MTDGSVELGCCAVCKQAQDICPEATFDWWEAGLAGFVCHACSQLTEVTSMLGGGSHRGDEPVLGEDGPGPGEVVKPVMGVLTGPLAANTGSVAGKAACISHLGPIPFRARARPTYGRGRWRPRSGGR